MKKSTWVFIAVLSVIIAGGLAYRHFAQELDSRGATRLMRALEENDIKKMESLLETADIHVRDKSGQTALFYAARHAQQPQIIHRLIVAGADPLATDKHGQTPLMVAAALNPNPVIVKVLAKQGGFSAAQQKNKDNALRVAAQQNGLPVIKMLLIAHANPSVPDEAGQQAADYLAGNTQLSDAEKADLRQVMLLLEILEERERFATNYAGKKFTKTKADVAAKPKAQATAKPKAAPKPVEKTAEEPAPQKLEEKPEPKAVEKETPPSEKTEPVAK